ncbi:uncharacterized protein MYCFIDRAFT_211574 [Pseudocercospora fijiensis CIRAD86]|uniref:Uncharacterized protein n=1 Tax=Pseudocercospora fijiensis (strain CIRAD86) TaxID=383855 RepID=M3AXP7_PSEFD|nr:uncharacterized protein MYCFIDRAFT_211574 [Pseudocercospora fijiensis CIRAD86]EME82232.1 hypothetical protein MYCFIDRAFT_211574 [Pseudocercospora fijiensis CIRAD86]
MMGFHTAWLVVVDSSRHYFHNFDFDKVSLGDVQIVGIHDSCRSVGRTVHGYTCRRPLWVYAIDFRDSKSDGLSASFRGCQLEKRDLVETDFVADSRARCLSVGKTSLSEGHGGIRPREMPVCSLLLGFCGVAESESICGRDHAASLDDIPSRLAASACQWKQAACFDYGQWSPTENVGEADAYPLCLGQCGLGPRFPLRQQFLWKAPSCLGHL